MNQETATEPNAAGQQGATRVRYRVLAIGCALALLIYIQRQGFVSGMPVFRATFGLTRLHTGCLAAAFLIAYGIFQVPCGLIGDRLGARHLLTILVLGWSLVTGLTAVTGLLPADGVWAFTLLLCLRFLFGAFQAGGFPIWARVITDWMPLRERATAQGTVWMFSRLGGALAPFLLLWLLRACGTWTTPFWLLAGLGILWCAVFWPWFRNHPEEMKRVNTAECQLIAQGRAATVNGRDAIPWSTLLRSVNVWALCLMYGFGGFAGNFITNLLPVYLEADRKLSPDEVASLTSLPLAFGVVSCVLGGVLSDWIIRRWGSRKWGRRLNASLGLASAGLAILVVPWVHATWLLALLLSASFFCNDLSIGPAWAACADVGERYAGTISGAMNMTGQFFGAAGMVLAGFMLDRGHAELLFAIFACSYALAALCWLAVDVTRPLVVGGAEGLPQSR